MWCMTITDFLKFNYCNTLSDAGAQTQQRITLRRCFCALCFHYLWHL